MMYILRLFLSKMQLFHNTNVFGSCIIHILYTGCAKTKKKKFRRQKVNNTNKPTVAQKKILIKIIKTNIQTSKQSPNIT